MNAEIIAVGTEILLGDIMNTHAQFLAKELAALGFDLHFQSVVGDNRERLVSSLKESLDRSDIVVLTGGLGPTNDDLTKETACELLGENMELNQEALDRIRRYFSRRGQEMPENNIKQAMLPPGCTVFFNDYGTAPGAAIEKNGKCVILLPGPPRELIPMFQEQVRPYLQKFSNSNILSHTLTAFGIGESAIAEKLGRILENPNPTVALYAKDGEVQIRVTAKAATAELADGIIMPMIQEITHRLGDYIYGVDAPNIHSVVIGLLREQRMMIATAESCTGGMLSQKLTEITGASEVFEFGVASYSNRIKEKILGIPKEIIDRCGAVSSEVAMLMAIGAQREGNADIGVGITGIAGPGGGTAENPVGRVYVGVTYKNKYWVEKLTIGHGASDERDYIRKIATMHALNMVRLILEGSPRAVEALAPIPEIPAIAPLGRNGVAFSGEVNPEKAGAGEMTFVSADKELAAEVSPDGTAAVKRPWYQRLAMYIFPWKGDSAQEIIRKIIFLIALITLIGSSIYILDYLKAQVQIDSVFKETLSLYDREPTEEELANLPDGYLEKFAALYNQNQEIKGWITIPNSRVNFPVMQTDNNDYYLDHSFNRTSNRYGAPFVDWRCTVGANGQLSTNTIIYGHNGSGGKVFCDVKNYANLSFYKGSPTITFDTVYEESQWKVFGVILTNGSPDGGYFFQYHNFINAESDEHFEWFIRQIERRTLINTTVDVLPTDQLLTLSTCSKKSDLDDGRLVVFARKVRPGESASVDVRNATVNQNPLYPLSWYKQHNKTAPDFPNDPDPSGGDNTITPAPGDNTTSTYSRPDNTTSSRRPDDPIRPSSSRVSSSGTSSTGSTSSGGASSGGVTSGSVSSGGTVSGGTSSGATSGGTSSGNTSSGDASSGATASNDTSSSGTSSTASENESSKPDASSAASTPSETPTPEPEPTE